MSWNHGRYQPDCVSVLPFNVLSIRDYILSTNLAARYERRASLENSDSFRFQSFWIGLRELIQYPMGGRASQIYRHNMWLDVGRVSGIIPFCLLLIYSIKNFANVTVIWKTQKSFRRCDTFFCSCISARMSTTYTTSINFIGDTGMFKVESGSFTKDYDEKTDRLVFTVNGKAALNTLSLTLAGMDVNSASYVLPITNNITINIQSGNVTINQDAALLAGVEVNIAEGAGLTVANGKNIYFYDSDEWNSDNFVWGPASLSPWPMRRVRHTTAPITTWLMRRWM